MGDMIRKLSSQALIIINDEGSFTLLLSPSTLFGNLEDLLYRKCMIVIVFTYPRIILPYFAIKVKITINSKYLYGLRKGSVSSCDLFLIAYALSWVYCLINSSQ